MHQKYHRYTAGIQFSNGSYPVKLKEAKIIPIYKRKENKEELENYRPIALQLVFEALLERRILNFNNKQINNGKWMVVVFLDIQKAFDCWCF